MLARKMIASLLLLAGGLVATAGVLMAWYPLDDSDPIGP